MAWPMAHAYPTVVIILSYMAVDGFPKSILEKRNFLVAAIIFLGQYMDFFDHLSFERVRRLLVGNFQPVENHINWMHTWTAVFCVFGLSVAGYIIWGWVAFFPCYSYVVHIVMDSAGDQVEGTYKNSPMPWQIHKKLFDKGKKLHRFSYKMKLLDLKK